VRELDLDGARALLLTGEDYAILTEADFGAPGLQATEVLGPFVPLHACGPLLTVHDARMQPHLGIGHHPHRFNERLFYILEGAMDHDDALNGIRGRMERGDLGRLTEGRRGMLHQEWNHGDSPARAFILVYETEPVPERASFAVLRDAEAPRYEEAPGVQSKELVGPRARFTLHGDIRLYLDSALDEGAALEQTLAPGEGALLYPLEGELALAPDGPPLVAGECLLLVPGPGERRLRTVARRRSRLLRAVFGPGRGLVLGRPLPRPGG